MHFRIQVLDRGHILVVEFCNLGTPFEDFPREVFYFEPGKGRHHFPSGSGVAILMSHQSISNLSEVGVQVFEGVVDVSMQIVDSRFARQS